MDKINILCVDIFVLFYICHGAPNITNHSGQCKCITLCRKKKEYKLIQIQRIISKYLKLHLSIYCNASTNKMCTFNTTTNKIIIMTELPFEKPCINFITTNKTYSMSMYHDINQNKLCIMSVITYHGH